MLSELGLGGAPLGNLYRSVSDKEADDTLECALAAGIRYVDSAPYYGFGLSERRVGDALRDRKDVVISTKVGRLLEPDSRVTDTSERFGFHSAMPFAPVFDYTYDGIMKSWESSLQRLGLPRIDILFIHDIGRLTHGERHQEMLRQLIDGGGMRAIAKLRAGGDIGAFGVGVNEIQICMDLLQIADLDVILLAGRYTLLEQNALEELFPACERSGTSVVIGGPYNSGILATGVNAAVSPRFNYEAASMQIRLRVQRLEAVCDEFNVSLPAAALQFVLAHPQVASVIPGLCGTDQVLQTLENYRAHIPWDFWNELKSQHLIRDDAPLPKYERARE